MHVGPLSRIRWFALLLGWLWSLGALGQDIFRQPGRWLDDQQQPFELSALRGQATVMTMAYGACRRICATSLRAMEQIQKLADDRRLNLNFVVVGLDPTVDRPSDWAQLRAERGLVRGNWRFLSGDEASTRRLARSLGIQYWRYGEHTLHDFRIVLLSPDGRPARQLDAVDQPVAALLP